MNASDSCLFYFTALNINLINKFSKISEMPRAGLRVSTLRSLSLSPNFNYAVFTATYQLLTQCISL